MEDFRIFQRKNVCDNNCKPINPVEVTLTEGPNIFKDIDILKDYIVEVRLPLILYQGFCCDPFKDKKELFEVLDRLRKNNSESKEFENNEIEKILYRMFPLDYSCHFEIDGIRIDESGLLYYLVALDNYPDTKVPATVKSDGMILNEENPSEYQDKFYRKRERKKDLLREIMLKIAILNSDINDLSINNKTNYYELLEEEKEVNRLKEEIWNLYSEEGEYTSETQSETGLPLPNSINTKRAQTYFQKAIDNGLLKLENGKFSWIQIGTRGGKSQLDYFCGKVFEYKHSVNGNDGTSFPEEKLNELFGIDRMYSLLTQVYDAGKKQSWRRRIDELFE